MSNDNPHVPAQFVVRQHVTVGPAGWTEIDFRTAGWFDSAPGMEKIERAAGLDRGIYRRVTFRLATGAALQVTDAGASPGVYYNSMTTGGTVVLDAPKFNDLRRGPSKVWYNGPAGGEEFEIEVWFDIEGLLL